jgi:glycosyltransferase involved in cell wall biosynthesis
MLASVAVQTYPHIEHIVVDGGSRDGTAAIVRGSGARLLVSPGMRQAAAVNRGVTESRGEIVVVLNADDILYPTGIAALVDTLQRSPAALGAYGEATHIADDDRVIEPYPTRSFDAEALRESCFICQPAAAVRRCAWEAVGGMNPRLDLAMDYDFWIRLVQRGELAKTDELIAGSRMHRDNKTLARRGDVHREVLKILRAHYGYAPYTWVYAYASWLLDKNDQFFAAARFKRTAVLLSLVLGIALNPRHPLRYLGDWYGHRAIGRR